MILFFNRAFRGEPALYGVESSAAATAMAIVLLALDAVFRRSRSALPVVLTSLEVGGHLVVMRVHISFGILVILALEAF